MASPTTTCVVLGQEGVGKSSFISKYLYNYLPSKYIPTKHPKSSTYTFSFPPPSITLQIIESIEVPDLNFSSAIIVFDPSSSLSLDYVEKTLQIIQEKLSRKIGIVIVALNKGNSRQGKGRSLANHYNASFLVADLTKRNLIKQCFAISLQWGRKNLVWESRKPFIYLREKTKLNISS
jgi:hypothetical protein